MRGETDLSLLYTVPVLQEEEEKRALSLGTEGVTQQPILRAIWTCPEWR